MNSDVVQRSPIVRSTSLLSETSYSKWIGRFVFRFIGGQVTFARTFKLSRADQ